VRIPLKSSTDSDLIRPPIPVFIVHSKRNAALARGL
jgi:hypothetical protein